MAQEDDGGRKMWLLSLSLLPAQVQSELNLALQFLWLQILESEHFMLDMGLTIQHTPALTQ
jgi:hypothetical protein